MLKTHLSVLFPQFHHPSHPKNLCHTRDCLIWTVKTLIGTSLVMGKGTVTGEHYLACEELVDNDYIYYNYKKTDFDRTLNRTHNPSTAMSKLRMLMRYDPMSESVSFLAGLCVGD